MQLSDLQTSQPNLYPTQRSIQDRAIRFFLHDDLDSLMTSANFRRVEEQFTDAKIWIFSKILFLNVAEQFQLTFLENIDHNREIRLGYDRMLYPHFKKAMTPEACQNIDYFLSLININSKESVIKEDLYLFRNENNSWLSVIPRDILDFYIVQFCALPDLKCRNLVEIALNLFYLWDSTISAREEYDAADNEVKRLITVIKDYEQEYDYLTTSIKFIRFFTGEERVREKQLYTDRSNMILKRQSIGLFNLEYIVSSIVLNSINTFNNELLKIFLNSMHKQKKIGGNIISNFEQLIRKSFNEDEFEIKINDFYIVNKLSDNILYTKINYTRTVYSPENDLENESHYIMVNFKNSETENLIFMRIDKTGNFYVYSSRCIEGLSFKKGLHHYKMDCKETTLLLRDFHTLVSSTAFAEYLEKKLNSNIIIFKH